MTVFSPREPVCFISAHLDDVVLSCGHFLAAHPGVEVITVFTAAPEITDPDGPNERTTKQSFAPAALDVRRREDKRALALLKAHSHWLGLWESEYAGEDQNRRAIVKAIEPVLADLGATSVVAPLGFHHSDHVAVGDACLEIARASDLDWYLYADMPAAQNHEQKMIDRLDSIAAKVNLDKLEPPSAIKGAKLPAFDQYASQIDDVRNENPANFKKAMDAPEQFWQVLSFK